MIIETAQIDIASGQESDFEMALDEAKNVLAKAKGFKGISVHRGVERPNVYLLTLKWDTVEDHTVGFRESDLFVQWRTLIGPFFANAPIVEHWELLNQ
ncbi:MAG: antibiotic biosynthesis monooxygenase [Actinobacteria bacterium]|nr:antibiotic biosynthesis monooxygenase [Actinomycetota bacterium]NBY15116.1 antibiotic biosynthesis monooxygenase [Actinomycetota bacterium]